MAVIGRSEMSLIKKLTFFSKLLEKAVRRCACGAGIGILWGQHVRGYDGTLS